MRTDLFNAEQLLELWEEGGVGDPAGRGQAFLEAIRPDWQAVGREQIGLGTRDAWVLELRRRLFGESIGGVVRCPSCRQLLQIELSAGQVSFAPLTPEPAPPPVVELEASGYRVVARSPDLVALGQAAACRDVGAARASLLASCFVQASCEGMPVAVAELPESVISAAGDAIAEADPQAEVRVELVCAVCATAWAAVFDVVHYLWKELSVAAGQLVDEVHTLAQAYAWPESEILKLSAWRRRAYLERLSNG
jgi:hypothetical protein